jgi:hypothetical protein
MKSKTLILLSILGLSFTTLLFSCTKEATEEATMDALLNAKGSINLTAGSQNYTKLFSSVVYSESDSMVSFWGINLDTEDSFITTFGVVPEVGQTKQVSTTGDDIIFMISGSFQSSGLYTGTSGTIKRLTTDKYEIDVELENSQDPSGSINISGSITVGENK